MDQDDLYDYEEIPHSYNLNGEVRNDSRKDMKLAGLFFFLLMILEIPMALLIYAVQDMFPAEKETLISVLMTQGYLLAAALIYIVIRRKSFRNDLCVRSYKLSSFFLSVLVLICASPMANCLNVVSQFFTSNRASQAIFEITENVPAWLAIIIVGCLPGFVEETIYRGIIFSAFRKYSVLVGVIISALSFGLMHLNFNQMLYAVYLGIIFAFLVEATGSLTSTMILHMLFNAVNTGYLFLLPALLSKLKEMGVEEGNLSIQELLDKTPTNAELMSSLKFFLPLAAGGLFLTVVLIKQIAVLNGRELTWETICAKREGATDGARPINIWIILGWLFCLLISVRNI
ncbi:MAG: CPBP family intramembrane metalloprotease [Lachnospiraceae bacterium]|nr:CPBP family intramembrane metalloprotease [Lachnospiraceae bacterium]